MLVLSRKRDESIEISHPSGDNIKITVVDIQGDKIRLGLEKENIEARPLWKPMHQQPIFEKYPSYINGVSDDLFERGLCFPSGSNLTKEDLLRVVACIKGIKK